MEVFNVGFMYRGFNKHGATLAQDLEDIALAYKEGNVSGTRDLASLLRQVMKLEERIARLEKRKIA